MINMDATKAMKFCRYDRLVANDVLYMNRTALRYVTSFKYLVILPTNGRVFAKHMTNRVQRAVVYELFPDLLHK